MEGWIRDRKERTEGWRQVDRGVEKGIVGGGFLAMELTYRLALQSMSL